MFNPPPPPKSHLYLALYSRDGLVPTPLQLQDDRYHWALLAIHPERNQATRFHARDFFSSPDQTHWIYEEIHVDGRGTPKLLARTSIGDVVDEERLLEVLRDVPIAQEARAWNCVSWVEAALEAVEADGEVVVGGSGSGRASGLRSWSRLRQLALGAADAESGRRLRELRAKTVKL